MLLRWSRMVVLAALVAVAAAARSGAEALHLRLTRSAPPADTTLATAPTTIRFWFSERPDVAVFTTKLTDTGGTAVTTAKPRWASSDAGAPIVVDITGAVKPGKYAVAWKAMSRDGHPVSGRFSFTVAP